METPRNGQPLTSKKEWVNFNGFHVKPGPIKIEVLHRTANRWDELTIAQAAIGLSSAVALGYLALSFG